MVWHRDSWAFARLLGERRRRTLAGALCILAAAGFSLGAAGLIPLQPWTLPVSIASAMVSASLFVLFCDGRLRHLDHQGGVGVLIDLAIVAAPLLLR